MGPKELEIYFIPFAYGSNGKNNAIWFDKISNG